MRHDRSNSGTPASSVMPSRSRTRWDDFDEASSYPDQYRPSLRPTGVIRAYATMLAIAGGAAAAATVVGTHEAHAADHPEASVGDDAPVASIGHVLSGAQQPDVPESRLLPARPAGGVGRHDDVSNINKSVRLAEERAAAAAEEARRQAAAEREAWLNRVVWPVEGRVTSTPGARWGLTHYGLDIANEIGTPIVAAKRGTVIEAGSASGFGLWVRVQHEDGTIAVYGHIDSYSVAEGETVEAGEVIAEVGNRGQSTGPHLHFEIWNDDSRKVNPLTWLQNNGARA